MPVLQLDDQQFPLNAGSTRIGTGAGSDVVVPGYSTVPVEAVIDGGVTSTIRRADEAAHVRVNGVLLGAEPTPLMHGDKVEVAGLELRFADDTKGGATQFVSASEIAALAGAKRSGAARATAASGGRLVSLVDGKEYTVADSGMVFGREASCDVVVAETEVSRRHASIGIAGDGYLLTDTSANGVLVNGIRVQGEQKLSRADVVRIGTEEFRFYADVLPAKPTPPVAASPVPPVTAAEPVPAPAPATTLPLSDMFEVLDVPEPVAPLPVPPAIPVAPASAQSTAPVPSMPAAPAVPASPSTPAAAPTRDDPRPVLATLEWVNEGPTKGTMFDLRNALSHIGRGLHNDVRLQDESVSETHAKLQRREDGWYVVDMDSTNGTYVGGNRVTGERRLEGSPDVRFGGMKFRFKVLGAGSASDIEAKGTKAIARVTLGPAGSTQKTPLPPVPTISPTPAATPTAAKGGIPAWIWIVVVLVVAGAAFFVLKGRA